MKRTIMTYGGYFERFIMTLSYKERKKIDYIVSSLYLTMTALWYCLTVLLRKARRTPPNEIEKAFRIREEYYEDKRSQNKEL